MKKILLILGFVLYSLTGVSASECSQSCKISDAPAPVLAEYLSNLQDIRENIIDLLSENDVGGKSLQGQGAGILQSMNSIMNFSGHFGSFDYYITTPLFNSIPSQVKRDHDLILKETKQLTQILKLSVERSSSNTNIGAVCGGINNCDLDNTSAQVALTELIKNNQQILRFYRALITDDEFAVANTSYLLVGNTFQSEMRNHYNASTLNACSKCAGEFGDILDDITDMSSRFKEIGNSTQVWQDTWNLLWSDSSTPTYQALEKDLLSDYLEGEGVPTQQADIMLGNLERANAGGLSTSNPLINSAKELGQTRDSFAASIREGYDELFGKRETIPYIELSRINTEIQTSDTIASAIATVYENELPFVVVQDTNTQVLQARIIQMHFSLVRTSNLLYKKIDDTEKICKKQGKLLGRCQFDLILR